METWLFQEKQKYPVAFFSRKTKISCYKSEKTIVSSYSLFGKKPKVYFNKQKYPHYGEN